MDIDMLMRIFLQYLASKSRMLSLHLCVFSLYVYASSSRCLTVKAWARSLVPLATRDSLLVAASLDELVNALVSLELFEWKVNQRIFAGNPATAWNVGTVRGHGSATAKAAGAAGNVGNLDVASSLLPRDAHSVVERVLLAVLLAQGRRVGAVGQASVVGKVVARGADINDGSIRVSCRRRAILGITGANALILALDGLDLTVQDWVHGNGAVDAMEGSNGQQGADEKRDAQHIGFVEGELFFGFDWFAGMQNRDL